MVKNNVKLFSALHIFLVIALLISAFLVYEKFVPSASEFCSISEGLDCGIVNESPYANLDGISYLLTIDFGLPLPIFDFSSNNGFFDIILSVAFLGFLTMLFIIFLRVAKYKNKDFLWVRRESNIKWVRGLLVFGVIFGVGYLFSIQHFILKTYCLICISLDIAMVVATILAFTTKE